MHRTERTADNDGCQVPGIPVTTAFKLSSPLLRGSQGVAEYTLAGRGRVNARGRAQEHGVGHSKPRTD